MTPTLRWLIVVTDIAFMAYWTIAAASTVGILHVDPALMYADYDDPRVVAWNWSFFPLDVIFSITGLAAVRGHRRGSRSWRSLALISLVLTMTAGGMAVTYWTLLGEFDPSWYLPNLLLLIWPMFFLRRLLQPASDFTS